MLILSPIPSGLLSLDPLLYNFPPLLFFESVLSPFLYDSYYPVSIALAVSGYLEETGKAPVSACASSVVFRE